MDPDGPDMVVWQKWPEYPDLKIALYIGYFLTDGEGYVGLSAGAAMEMAASIVQQIVDHKKEWIE